MTNPTFADFVSRPALAGDDSATLAAEVTAGWLQGKAAFGGLQGALGALAMRAAVGDALPLRALQMTFVGPIEAGAAHAEARVLRRGRAMTHAQCTLQVGGRTAALLVGLYGQSRASAVHVPMPMPEDVRPLASLREAPYLPGVMPGFLQHYRQRWAGGAIPYSGSPVKPSRLWLQLREAVPADGGAPSAALAAPAAREANVVALADMPPSPAMAMLRERAPGASLTWLLELFVDAREFDPARWLLLQTETRFAEDGYTSQTARIWDDAGRPVGVSHQTTAIFG